MRIRRRSAIAGAAVVAVAAAALAFHIANPFADPMATIALRPDDPATVSRGEGVYRVHCASCHGAALEGQPNWHARGPDGLLLAPRRYCAGTVLRYSRRMPPLSTLPLTLPSPRIRRRQSSRSASATRSQRSNRFCS